MELALDGPADLALRIHPLEDEVDRRRQLRLAGALRESSLPRRFVQALHFRRARDEVRGRQGVVDLQAPAEVEPLRHLPEIRVREPPVEHEGHGAADHFAGHGVGPFQLALVFELELPGDRRDGPPLGVRDDVLQQRDRQPLADARALVHFLVLPRLERDLFDHLAHVLGDRQLDLPAFARGPRLLLRDLHRLLAARRIVRADLRSDAVLQRGDDLAARRVVFRVRAEDDQQVQREAHGVALNLNVPFLQDVEEADLDLAGEVRQLVDREDAAVGARHQAVVHRELIRQLEAGARRLDRIEIADHVGDRHVRRREFLHVALVRLQPRDRQIVARLARARPACRAQRRDRVVMDFAAGDDGQRLVEQGRQGAEEARFRLAPQAEQDEVVPREHRVHHLGDDRVVVADDAGKEGLAGAELANQVVADLRLDGAPRDAAGLDVSPKRAEGRRLGGHMFRY